LLFMAYPLPSERIGLVQIAPQLLHEFI